MSDDQWMDVDVRDNAPDTSRDEQRLKAVEFAQLYYSTFVQNSAGVALLKHWVETIEQRDVPPTASHAEFSYWESRRAFVRGILRQLELARTEGFK